ncbi:MAG: hypothetical protein ACRCST_03415 [Turicibacter sp.]
MDDDDDAILGALVDGLSGALCVILLVSVVFIVSTGKKINALRNEILTDESVVIDGKYKSLFVKKNGALSSKSLLAIDNIVKQSMVGKISLNSDALKSKEGLLFFSEKKAIFEGVRVFFVNNTEFVCSDEYIACLRFE